MAMRILARTGILTAIVLVMLCLGATASHAALASDPAVTLVSPPAGETEAVVTDNFLISVKVTQAGRTLRISAFELRLKAGDKWVSVKPDEIEAFDAKKDEEKTAAPIMDPEPFESKGNVSFFTRKLENITPGVYVIRVETLDGDGKAVYQKEARIFVKEKSDEEAKVFENAKSGASQFLQTILSKIFKN